MRYQNIIFDLDGTLWNSCEGCTNIWNAVLEKTDPSLPKVTLQEMENTMGQDKEGFRKALLPMLSKEEGLALVTQIFSQFNENIPTQGWKLYKGVQEGLKKLSAQHGLFIVSNCQEGYLQMFNQCTGIIDNYIQDFEYIGRTGRAKGENIQNVIARNQLTSPIYIGDTQGDKDASAQAKVDFGFAAYGLGEASGVNLSFTSFEHLVDFFVD